MATRVPLSWASPRSSTCAAATLTASTSIGTANASRSTWSLPVANGRYLWPIFQVCSLAFFICGAALGLLRPQDGQVRFVSGLLMAAASTALQEASGAPRGFLDGWERFVYLALPPTYMLFCPMTYHFFSRFPTWQRPGPLWRSIQWVLYALLVLVFGPAWVLISWGPPRCHGGHQRVPRRTSLALPDRVSTGTRGLRLHGRVPDARAGRGRAQLSVRARSWQSAPDSMGDGVIDHGLRPHRDHHRVSDHADGSMRRRGIAVYPLTFLAMLAIPASIATAVWKEQLFDVRVIVRRGLQYLFARAALRTLLVLPVALLLFSIFGIPIARSGRSSPRAPAG